MTAAPYLDAGLGTALDLAGRFHLFPVDSPELERCAGLRTREHDPETCTDRGKHPCVKWRDGASRDTRQLAAWFVGAPRNIGVNCGASKVLVADEDTIGDLARYAASVGEVVPETYTVQTGRGFHYYFEAPHDVVLGNAEGKLKPYGVNVRGDGGYVVGPGSLHASGALYSVKVDVDPAPVPAWLVDALRTSQETMDDATGAEVWDLFPPTGLAAVPGVIRGPRVGAPGERHDVLMRYASSLRARDVPIIEASTLLRAVWQRCEQPPACRSPMTWADARALLTDVFNRYTPNESRADPQDAAADTEVPDSSSKMAMHVSLEADRIRVRAAAQIIVAAEVAGKLILPAMTRLDAFLAVPDDDTPHRVAGLWPTGGRVVLSAQHKAGKTTTTGNLVRSLVDGDPFLDAFDVTPANRVVIIDDELDERMLRRWLRDQGVQNVERVDVLPLRGRLSSFNILDATTRARWAEHIGPADVLTFDCLRPALDALGLSEDKDAGRFLESLDELTAEAGISEALVVHHMGHQNERSRGDSRIQDWPDVLWKLVRDAEDDDDTTDRRVYFSAYGRDVDQPEALLSYDRGNRHLSVAGGSRSHRKAEAAVEDVLDVLARAAGPLSGRAIDGQLRGSEHPQKVVRAAVQQLVSDGRITKETRHGKGGGNAYRL